MKIGVRCAIIIFAVFALILPARLHARIVTRAPTCCGASCRATEPAVSGSRQPFGSSTFPLESADFHNDALRRRPSRRGALRPASPSPSRQSTPLRHPTPWRLRRSPEAHPRLPCALGRHRAMCVLYTKGCIATPADARPKLSPQLGIESAVSSGIKKAGACMITMTPRAGLVFLVWRTVLLSRRLDLLRCYLLPL